ncbi:hypothetical protein GS399_14300 [Pedobacter sp. HMF7647]|uniref:Uncharacterized protein n=1 Tax=Hufsiella arboris TaxID=2695275 RepID=A0A7K1YC36_9SPHI|nr:hypothetical protein [Hufsiella arboris]MXV52146.1 hypothetical protein [Hufsiella arboris]
MESNKHKEDEDPLTANNNFGTAGSETEEEYRKRRTIKDPHSNPTGFAENNESHTSRTEGLYETRNEPFHNPESEKPHPEIPTGKQISHSENVGGTKEGDLS